MNQQQCKLFAYDDEDDDDDNDDAVFRCLSLNYSKK